MKHITTRTGPHPLFDSSFTLRPSSFPMTLRQRLLLTLTPSLVLLALLGGVGIFLLQLVSNRIGEILHENYDSVVFMVSLNEALERIDSSFNYAMLGDEEAARSAYAANWRRYQKELRHEQNNVTLEGEQELVDQLVGLTERYRADGDRFFTPGRAPEDRRADYLGAPGRKGLLRQFQDIKEVTE